MIKILIHIILALIPVMVGTSIIEPTFAADCQFDSSNIIAGFKKCNPDIGVRTTSNIDLKVTKDGDFREITATFIKRIQIIASVIAIGIIIWIGLILVLPTKAETKESAKTKIISVVLGFLLMIVATIIVNGLINILYEVFK